MIEAIIGGIATGAFILAGFAYHLASKAHKDANRDHNPVYGSNIWD